MVIRIKELHSGWQRSAGDGGGAVSGVVKCDASGVFVAVTCEVLHVRWISDLFGQCRAKNKKAEGGKEM